MSDEQDQRPLAQVYELKTRGNKPSSASPQAKSPEKLKADFEFMVDRIFEKANAVQAALGKGNAPDKTDILNLRIHESRLQTLADKLIEQGLMTQNYGEMFTGSSKKAEKTLQDAENAAKTKKVRPSVPSLSVVPSVNNTKVVNIFQKTAPQSNAYENFEERFNVVFSNVTTLCQHTEHLINAGNPIEHGVYKKLQKADRDLINLRRDMLSSPFYSQHQEDFYRAQEMLADVLKRLSNRDALPTQDADPPTDGHPQPRH